VSDEVKCLKLSLLNLTIVDVEALWEELDNDGMKMNIVHSYVMQVAALSHAIRSVQADPEHDVEQLALLHKQIVSLLSSISSRLTAETFAIDSQHERVKLVSNQVVSTSFRCLSTILSALLTGLVIFLSWEHWDGSGLM